MKVKVVFYGLCAFVPEQEPPGKVGVLRTLLPDTTSPTDEDRDAGLTEHYPKLHYFVGATCHHCVLNRDEVSIVDKDGELPAGGVNFLKGAPSLTRFEMPYGSSQTRDHQWLEWIGLSYLPYKEVDRDLLSGAVSPRLAARIILSGGSFRTGAVTNYKTEPIPWEFKLEKEEAPPLSLRRTLAFQMVWEAEIEGPKICIRKADGSNPEYTPLKPREGTDYAEVWITNLSPLAELSLVRRREERGERIRQEIKKDRNFRWFYKLARGYDSSLLATLPFPWPTCFVGKKAALLAACDYTENFGLLGGGPVRCPQVRFSAAESPAEGE